jgi:hypothetical protein
LLKFIQSPMAWEDSRCKSLLSYWLAKIKVMKNLQHSSPSDHQAKSVCSSRIFTERVVWIKEWSASIIHTVNDLQCCIFVAVFKHTPRLVEPDRCAIFYIKISSDSPFESSCIFATHRRSGPYIFLQRSTRPFSYSKLLVS